MWGGFPDVVSIPHRYCKNNARMGSRNFLEIVSIPHRYCKNMWGGFPEVQVWEVSIPHRYCKNIYIINIDYSLLCCFNSS